MSLFSWRWYYSINPDYPDTASSTSSIIPFHLFLVNMLKYLPSKKKKNLLPILLYLKLSYIFLLFTDTFLEVKSVFATSTSSLPTHSLIPGDLASAFFIFQKLFSLRLPMISYFSNHNQPCSTSLLPMPQTLVKWF